MTCSFCRRAVMQAVTARFGTICQGCTANAVVQFARALAGYGLDGAQDHIGHGVGRFQDVSPRAVA